ncbi:hypothetical protein [Alistipes sp. ZOR0009]|uniref:hypothetical protein n=1 Tax=Alistipes sp. ZOR0009 TaxID=1339253 RepID=UPI0012E02DF6|nr:hypothetical protein [Alistipes sp. ZOR0009]
MKHLIFVILLMGIISCEKKDDNHLDIKAGIGGNIQYGIGDCMPQIDESKIIYNNYNGILYFILKSEIEQNHNFEQLKDKSIKTSVKNGNFAIELPIGTYLIIPNDVYLYSDYNTVTIKENTVVKKSLKFWKCTSY